MAKATNGTAHRAAGGAELISRFQDIARTNVDLEHLVRCLKVLASECCAVWLQLLFARRARYLEAMIFQHSAGQSVLHQIHHVSAVLGQHEKVIFPDPNKHDPGSVGTLHVE